MKTSNHFNCRTSLTRTPIFQFMLIAAILLLGSRIGSLRAQDPHPVLSIQGILKKSSGEAVPDGVYSLTFKLYKNAETGSPVWTEQQDDIEVTSGIYSTVLGNSTMLSIAFDSIYFLGVTSGSTEMKPRIQLTSAPYALALIGDKNKFPSSGIVIADSIRVTNGVLARGGAPGVNGVNKNGYAFTTNNGDKDSGLFSLGNGQVSMYVNNIKMLTATPDSVAMRSDLRFNNGANIKYNGLDDWRLVETDYFENVNDAEEWKIYSPAAGQSSGWNNGTGSPATVTNFVDDFAGSALVSNGPNRVFKKKFTLPGSTVAGTYTYVKVVFKYYYLDSWDLRAEEKGWAAFSKTEACTELSVGWLDERAYASFGWGLYNGNNGQGVPFAQQANFYGQTGSAAYSDQWTKEEMVGRYPSGSGNADFWVIFGGTTDEQISTENFGVGMIEIWVK